MNNLTPERLAELRRIASAATPGPWAWRMSKDGRILDLITLETGYNEEIITPSHINAWLQVKGGLKDFIPAFDPATALALLDRVEELSLACAAALRVLVAAGLFEQDEDGNITADTRFYDDLCKLANAARYVADYATDGLVTESEACLRHQFDAARTEAERWKQQYEALRAGVESVAQELRKLAFSCAQDRWETGYPYHDGASDAYYEAEQIVRRVLGEAGGGGAVVVLTHDDCNILMHGLRDRGELEGHLIPEALERYEELCNRIIDVGTGYAGGAQGA